MGAIPSTNLDSGLNPAKGWFQMAALDFQAAIHSAVNFYVPDGRCMYLYTAGQYPKDCTLKTGVTNTSMPLFLWHGNNSYDVSNPGVITKNSRWNHQAIGPTGIAQALVGKGGYELETTEFVVTGVAYTPNQLLTAVTADTTEATGGKLTNAGTAASGTKVKQFTDTVVGVVSRGVFTNQDGASVLAFWPEWLPGTAPA